MRQGEIIALLGRNGAGKTSTLRTIARLEDPQLKHGEIWLDRQSLHGMKAHEAAQHGVALVPEDRKQHGIILEMAVGHNLSLASLKRDQHNGLLNDGAQVADFLIEPDVSRVDVGDFQHSVKIAEIGKAATEAVIDPLVQQLQALDRCLVNK